jgi:heme/copper-type cytochrome/quinol oxidase subunit 3
MTAVVSPAVAVTAPQPARPRTLVVGAVLASLAGSMLLVGMCSIYLAIRDSAGGSTKTWLPGGVIIPEVAANVMLAGLFGATIIIQWARYAINRDDRQATYVALGLTALIGLAMLNAQGYIWKELKLVISDEKRDGFQMLVYSITGTYFVLLLIGVIATALLAFRALGGRANRRSAEAVSAACVYWHFLFVAFCAVWLVVYVTK